MRKIVIAVMLIAFLMIPNVQEITAGDCRSDECRHEMCSCTVEVDYIGDFTAYAYCSCSRCCNPEWNGRTYTETVPEEGRTVAVDPSVIPLGTKLLLEYPDGSFREVIAEDTGSAIHGNVLDVYMADHERAQEHGAQTVRVYREVE